jgi:hypothetical protein
MNGNAVDVFEGRAGGNATGKTGELYGHLLEFRSYVASSCFAFGCWVCCKDKFRGGGSLKANKKWFDIKAIGANTFEGTDRAAEYVIETAKVSGTFDRDEIMPGFDDADDGTIAIVVGTDGTYRSCDCKMILSNTWRDTGSRATPWLNPIKANGAGLDEALSFEDGITKAIYIIVAEKVCCDAINIF